MTVLVLLVVCAVFVRVFLVPVYRGATTQSDKGEPTELRKRGRRWIRGTIFGQGILTGGILLIGYVHLAGAGPVLKRGAIGIAVVGALVVFVSGVKRSIMEMEARGPK